jgi:3-deoxy-D-manno-octulosonic-acid transferase
MHFFLFLVYDLLNGLYILLVRLAALFSPKARDFIRGRRNWQHKLEAILQAPGERIWFHFASLGEFEQGRTLMQQLRKEYPSVKIIITFFSPSGFNIRKKDPLADLVLYLPFDNRRNAAQFLDLLKPSLVVFVKYEFWLHYLYEIRQRHIPALLVSAVLRKDQLFFSPLAGKFYTSFLKAFRIIFFQDERSLKLSRELQLGNTQLAGDTRFDRVREIASKASDHPEIAAFKAERNLMVLGSSWPEEEDLLKELLQALPQSPFCFLIAPHDVSPTHIRQLRLKFPHALLYSEWDRKASKASILIIDSIGMLASVYRYADAALVGGGFGRGLHNILEPAAHGLPLMFGPRTEKFWEATALIQAGGAVAIKDKKEFISLFRKFILDADQRKLMAEKSKAFVEANRGATAKIMSSIRTEVLS